MRVLTLSRYLNLVFGFMSAITLGGGIPLNVAIERFGASTDMKLEKMKWISGVTINIFNTINISYRPIDWAIA